MKYAIKRTGGCQLVLVPPVYTFQLSTISKCPARFDRYKWYRMAELDRAVTSHLRQADYTHGQTDYIVDYASMAEFKLTKKGARGFDWISFPEGNEKILLHENETPRSCKFTTPAHLYVPVEWGDFVISFAKHGIVKMEKTETRKGWHCVKWDGKEEAYAGQDLTSRRRVNRF